MWIFAYGSLIFRPSFSYLERRAGWVRDHARRLWQGSPDHRGTPEAPGRVATLIAAPGAICGGCVYRIDAEGREAILAELDEREKAGFDRVELPIFDGPAPSAAPFARALAYVAREDNPHFLGQEHEELIARHVAASRGPSGPNAEYVLRLHAALRELGIDDPHVEAVVRHLA